MKVKKVGLILIGVKKSPANLNCYLLFKCDMRESHGAVEKMPSQKRKKEKSEEKEKSQRKSKLKKRKKVNEKEGIK